MSGRLQQGTTTSNPSSRQEVLMRALCYGTGIQPTSYQKDLDHVFTASGLPFRFPQCSCDQIATATVPSYGWLLCSMDKRDCMSHDTSV
jgi:hypothetical protein